MSKNITVEVLIATPPTGKCQETVAILEELVRRYPDEVVLTVFLRGVDFMPDELKLALPAGVERVTPEHVTPQMRQLIHKGSPVPTIVLNGELIYTCEVPKLEDLESRMQTILGVEGVK